MVSYPLQSAQTDAFPYLRLEAFYACPVIISSYAKAIKSLMSSKINLHTKQISEAQNLQIFQTMTLFLVSYSDCQLASEPDQNTVA